MKGIHNKIFTHCCSSDQHLSKNAMQFWTEQKET